MILQRSLSMLTNKDIYKSRDTTVSELVAQMMELKYFDEQFMYYATAYVENDVIKYRLNRSASAMYDFWANSMERHIYPTGVKRHVQLLKVPSGKEEEKAMEVRDTFIIKLQKMFPKELFQMLAALGAVPPTDGAKDLLEQWQDELELCYEEDQICLYAEASKEAYNRKILTDETWEKIKQWVKSRQEQISRNQNVIWNNKKYIYGYLFEQNGQL